MSSKPAASFHLVSEWWLPVAPERLWAVLTAPEDWPGWWPQVRTVESITPGDADGVGAIRHTRWGSRLPYGLSMDLCTLRVERLALLEVAATGDVHGVGEWRLTPIEGGTRVRYTWEIRLVRPWMRRLAPWLRRLFAWNHHQVMRAGARGMARTLGVPAPAYRALREPAGAATGRPQGVPD